MTTKASERLCKLSKFMTPTSQALLPISKCQTPLLKTLAVPWTTLPVMAHIQFISRYQRPFLQSMPIVWPHPTSSSSVAIWAQATTVSCLNYFNNLPNIFLIYVLVACLLSCRGQSDPYKYKADATQINIFHSLPHSLFQIKAKIL